MNRAETIALAVAVLLLLISGVLWLTRPGPSEIGPVVGEKCATGDQTAEIAPCGHDHTGNAAGAESEAPCDHDHTEGPGDLEMSLDEILAAECEHGTATHVCDDCRYEVGVVRVDASLVKPDPASADGLVNVVQASEAVTTSLLHMTGVVRLNESRAVRISPRTAGMIRSAWVDIGTVVKTGDVLFEIESTDLGRAVSEYEKNRTLTDLARQNYDRETALFEQKISSEWDVIETQMVLEEYRAELQASETALRVLGLTEEDIRLLADGAARWHPGCLPIRSPIDGVVIEKRAVMGERVEEGDDVMQVADLGDLWVWADVYEQDLATLVRANGRGPVPVEVTVHAFPGRVFAGEIDYVGAVMEETTRTVKVRATVANGDRLLRPGMFCEIRLRLGISGAALAVPKVALLSDEGVDFIFRHLKDDYFVRRRVETGRAFDDRVEILAGLDAGDRVVADGAFLLKSDVLRSKMGAG